MTSRTTGILTAENWLNHPFGEPSEKDVVIGSLKQVIVETGSKNLIEAPKKSFKTAFTQRLTLAMSCGQTVFTSLTIGRPQRVLYLHGELSKRQIESRTIGAAQGLPRPLDNFFQVRDMDAHLIRPKGRKRLDELVGEVKPEILVIDPWQSFITGYDENSFKEMSPAMEFLDALINEHALTLFVDTHAGKDPSRGTRGTSALDGWRDALIRLERKNTAGTVKLNVEPRWEAPLPEFYLQFKDGTVFDSTGEFAGQTEAIRNLISKAGQPIPRKDVGPALNITSDAARKAIQRAVKDGGIVTIGDEVALPGALEFLNVSQEASRASN